jgi:hypothetical protein
MPAMASERMPGGVPPAVLLTGSDAAPTDAARLALRVQMLATEHWSLLATRSMSWNEAFSRASMFLTLLTGAVVALALVAQATNFGEGFVLFALLVLPVTLFIGLATFVRLIEINNEDYVWVRGMNRLRAAYLAIDPELAPSFITGTSEDAAGIFRSFGSRDENLNMGNLHGFVTTPTTIAFVDAMIAAVLTSIVVVQMKMAMLPAAGVGVVAFLIAGIALGWFGYRNQTLARIAAELRTGDAEDPMRPGAGR